MFRLAIIIGLYSYTIFSIGILGLLNQQTIIVISIFYTLATCYFFRSTIKVLALQYRAIGSTLKRDHILKKLYKNKVLSFLLGLVLLQAFVNFIGTLGPEHAFDAVWYHLTIPKIYLLEHKVFFIPGGLFYYSAMPKLIEMLYITALANNTEILAKIIHFLFGILSLVALYKFARMFFTPLISLIISVIFYSNLVVAWESITAYIDLGRTFFEILALWSIMCWSTRKEKKWFIVSAVMLGFAISAKLLALGSLIAFSILIVLYSKNKKISQIITNILVYWLIILFIILPWLLFAYIHTGNPIYPFFTNIYETNFSISLLSPLSFITESIKILLFADDPISPIYLAFLPLLIIYFYKFRPMLKVITCYCLVVFVVWYITPRTGGGRFLLPYLPAFSLILGELYSVIHTKFRFVFLAMVITIAGISIMYRGLTNAKYIPFVFGQETKSQFLTQYLNFSYGDFYDIDGYFQKHIRQDDRVLLYGFHNLYYVDFPYIESSSAIKNDRFNYIATQNTPIPQKFSHWQKVYENSKTGVIVYTNKKSFFRY